MSTGDDWGPGYIGSPATPLPIEYVDQEAEDDALRELTPRELFDANLATATWDMKGLSLNLVERYEAAGDDGAPVIGAETERRRRQLKAEGEAYAAKLKADRAAAKEPPT